MKIQQSILFCVAATLSGCSDSGPPTASLKGALPGDVSPAYALGLPDGRVQDTLYVGQTRQLSHALPTSMGRIVATETRWFSWNENAVTVSPSGLATAVGPGSALVTAANNLLVEAATIVVLEATAAPPPAPSNPGEQTLVLSNDATTASMATGETRLVVATLPTSMGRMEATETRWYSWNENVIRVSGSGAVTAVAEGSALVTAANNLRVQAVTIRVTGAAVPAAPAPAPAPAPPVASSVELPRNYVSTAIPAVTGTTWRAATSADFQRALHDASPGDAIVLTAGATYTGNFELPRKYGDGWITIRTSTPDHSLPGRGERIAPAHASLLARIESPNQDPAIRTLESAHHYRLFGLEVTTAPSVDHTYSLIALGEADRRQSTLGQVPSDLLLDHLYVHGSSQLDFQRCVALNSARTAIVDSYLSDCHGRGYDSQAIAGWNGPGPFAIVNNYLEGAGENLMFGGADPAISGLIPSDIEIRGNHFHKPTAWRGVWTVKNLFELKMGLRVLVEGNIFENNWVDAQNGFGIVLKSANDDGNAPWALTADVTMRYNILRNMPHGISMAARPQSNTAVAMRNLDISHNSLENVGTGSFAGGRLLYAEGIDNLTIRHNSGVGATHGIILDGSSSSVTILDNVIGTAMPQWGTWNFAMSSAEGAGVGTAALDRHARTWDVRGNLFFGVNATAFPAGNSATMPDNAGFVSFPSNLALLSGSPLRGFATDGTAPGVDWAGLQARTADARN